MDDADSARPADGAPILSLIVIRSIDLIRSERFYSAIGLVLKRERHSGGPEHLVSRLSSTVFEIYSSTNR